MRCLSIAKEKLITTKYENKDGKDETLLDATNTLSLVQTNEPTDQVIQEYNGPNDTDADAKII